MQTAAGPIRGEGGEVTLNTMAEPIRIAQPTVPTQQEVEEMILRRKKMELLAKYVPDALLDQSHQAHVLFGDAPSASNM